MKSEKYHGLPRVLIRTVANRRFYSSTLTGEAQVAENFFPGAAGPIGTKRVPIRRRRRGNDRREERVRFQSWLVLSETKSGSRPPRGAR